MVLYVLLLLAGPNTIEIENRQIRLGETWQARGPEMELDRAAVCEPDQARLVINEGNVGDVVCAGGVVVGRAQP